MSDKRQDRPKVSKLAIQLFCTGFCFCVPTFVLMILFPTYSSLVGLIGCSLYFAASGLLIGLQWDLPEMELWRTWLLPFVVVCVIGLLYRGITGRVPKEGWIGLAKLVGLTSTFVISSYVPFFLGRFIARRRARS